MKKSEVRLREMWDVIKHTNIHKWEVSGEGTEEKEQKKFKEIMAKNFPNSLKSNLHIQEVQQIPKRINTRRSTDTS